MVNNKRVLMYMDISYLLLIAVSLGGVLTLGTFTAPVVFHSESLLEGALLNNYQEGVIMAEIFRRFSYWIYLLAAVVAVYELYEFKMMRRDRIAGLSAFAVVATSLMFSAIYTPRILEMQQQGTEATLSDTFISLHKGSELDFKILAAALLLLFFRRVMLLRFR
jgi:hypothetical protein